MKQELDDYLCNKYPKIFKDRHGDMRETCMCWGFDISDGWFDIIDALCANIQHHIKWQRKNRASDLKWNRKIKRLIASGEIEDFLRSHYKFEWQNVEEMVANPELAMRQVTPKIPQVVATQVKEKFATLRFYYDGGDDYIHGLVNMAESMSAVTCEQCGNKGKQRGNGWIYTACDACEEERRKPKT